MPQALTALTIAARFVGSLASLDSADWDRCNPGRPTNHAYFTAAEAAPPPGFSLGAVVAERRDGVVAVAPVFATEYRFDTALQGSQNALWRKTSDLVYRHAPRLVSMKMLSLGSPLTDDCHLGFAPSLSIEQENTALETMLGCLLEEARARNFQLVAVKGLSPAERKKYGIAFARHGFTAISTLPDVKLDLPHRSLDQYLARLPRGTGSYLKRKWRSAERVRIEESRDISGLAPKLNALYAATLRQSKVDYGNFSEMHPEYFSRVAKTLGDRAHVTLCWEGNELLSFQLFIVGAEQIFAAGIGMDYPRA